MAALVVQSRFAGLKIEDDDYPPSNDAAKAKKIKPAAAKKPEPVKKNKPSNGKAQQNNQPKKKKNKPQTPSSDQWETWKQKDEQLVNGNYESELEQAMLLSKLDYEEKKDLYVRLKKDAEAEKKLAESAARANAKKHKKKNVMSLEQFNDMVTGTGDENRLNPIEDCPHGDQISPQADTEFFERVTDEAKNEYLKDKINDRVKHRKPLSDETMSRIQFADAIEKKDKEIVALRLQVTSLKEDLLTVKSRNKKLCNILGQGEMRDKAEVLVELERLRGVQAELTAEVQALHTELERERSRHGDPRTKDNKKKKGGSADK